MPFDGTLSTAREASGIWRAREPFSFGAVGGRVFHRDTRPETDAVRPPHADARNSADALGDGARARAPFETLVARHPVLEVARECAACDLARHFALAFDELEHEVLGLLVFARCADDRFRRVKASLGLPEF